MEKLPQSLKVYYDQVKIFSSHNKRTKAGTNFYQQSHSSISTEVIRVEHSLTHCAETCALEPLTAFPCSHPEWLA